MCGAPETYPVVSHTSTENLSSNMSKQGGELTPDGCSDLLELAAKNDLKHFQTCLEEGLGSLDMVGMWYFRHNGSRKMVIEERTPLMIAALYGNLDVLKYILRYYAESGKDVNNSCGSDKSTALHCAAAGGSPFVLQTVNLLLKSGANLNSLDAQGRRPLDVISVPNRNLETKMTLEAVLNGSKSADISLNFAELFDTGFLPSSLEDSVLSSEGEEGISLKSSSALSTASGDSFRSSFSSSSQSSSPKSPPPSMVKVFNEKTGDFIVDPSILDIKNSIYTTDEFRMYSFKIRPCSRAYSHDWTECPFAHPGENAKRRDPRKYHYSCVPCPDFRKGSCQQGDACEFAHGVFECWLHPAQYRTRLCKDGTDCNRKVCFFAHTVEELRPLYVSTGSAVPSPRSSAFLDSPSVSSPLGLTSPLMMSSFSPIQQGTSGTPPMSPSSPSAFQMSGPWSQPKVPVLHLPSRLRSSVKAHDVVGHDIFCSPEMDKRMLHEYQTLSGQQLLSTQARVNAAVAASKNTIPSSQRRKFESIDLPMSPLNLDELFAMESVASPKACSRVPQSPSNLQSALAAQVSAQKAVLESHYHGSQLQSPRSPSGYVIGSFSNTRGTEMGMSESLASAKAAQLKKEKLSIYKSADKACDFLYSNWGSPTGKLQWGMQDDELLKMNKPSSPGYRVSQEPDLSWVQNVVSEGPSDVDWISCSAAAVDNIKEECPDMSHLEAWIDKLQFDQIVA